VAAEDDNLKSIQIRNQNSAIECTSKLEIGITNLTLGTNLNSYTEEVIHSKGFSTFYKFGKFFSFFSSKLKRKFKLKKIEDSLIESRCFRLDELDCECKALTIDQSSAVDGSSVAAEGEYLIISQIRRQNPAVDCALIL
jgi:hypothetical protein